MVGELKINKSLIHHIFHDVLQFQKSLNQWVSEQLALDLKEHEDVCETFAYEVEGDGFSTI